MRAGIFLLNARLGLVLFCSAFFLTLFLAQGAEAHDRGWRWKFPEIIPLFENRTTNYGTAITSSKNDYDLNTDLTVNECPSNGLCGNLIFIEANYGATLWAGRAEPYSASNACSDSNGYSTGYCNTTNHRVDFAYVYYNSHWGVAPTNNATRHEPGHAFGLAHTPCTLKSVMKPGDCESHSGILRPHDKSDINGYY